jgi:hypothetical protein
MVMRIIDVAVARGSVGAVGIATVLVVGVVVVGRPVAAAWVLLVAVAADRAPPGAAGWGARGAVVLVVAAAAQLPVAGWLLSQGAASDVVAAAQDNLVAVVVRHHCYGGHVLVNVPGINQDAGSVAVWAWLPVPDAGVVGVLAVAQVRTVVARAAAAGALVFALAVLVVVPRGHDVGTDFVASGRDGHTLVVRAVRQGAGGDTAERIPAGVAEGRRYVVAACVALDGSVACVRFGGIPSVGHSQDVACSSRLAEGVLPADDVDSPPL